MKYYFLFLLLALVAGTSESQAANQQSGGLKALKSCDAFQAARGVQHYDRYISHFQALFSKGFGANEPSTCNDFMNRWARFQAKSDFAKYLAHEARTDRFSILDSLVFLDKEKGSACKTEIEQKWEQSRQLVYPVFAKCDPQQYHLFQQMWNKRK